MDGGPQTGGKRTARAPHRRTWSWIGAGALAAVRGLGLCGLMLAGLCLVLALLLPLILAGLGIALLASNPEHYQQAQAVAVGVAPFAGVAGGLVAIPAILLGMRRLAMLTRGLCARWCAVLIADPYRPPPGAGQLSFTGRLRWLLGDPAGRRDALWFAVNACGGWVLAAAPAALIGYGLLCLLGGNRGYAIVPAPPVLAAEAPLLLALGLASVAFGLWAARWLLRGYGLLARSMLAPSGQAELSLRVAHLARSRADTIDAGAAELRRIERDLHDGAQARLVALGMTLDAAGQLLDDDPSAVRALLAEARESSVKALVELRDLVRGIHPPVLADRGLAEAVRALALDAPLRVHFTSELPGRPPAPVESAAYFAVSELLANVSKHAHASQAWVDLRYHGGMLRIGVSDDGSGGTDPASGTGLRGIERRLATFDGVLAVSSPPGGPTVVNMEISCVLSSPKTTSC